MSDESPQRRVIDLMSEISAAVRQAVTPMQITLDRLDDSVHELERTVYGDPKTRQRGLVERIEDITAKLDTLIDQSRSRQNLIRGIAIGLAVNILQGFGVFELIGHLLKVLAP